MAKKTFKDNPALQFISEVVETDEREQAETVATEAAPEGYHKNPLYIENKSKRLQLVLQPSLFDRVKAKAKSSGLSVNEYCHQVLDKATREE